MIGRRDFDAVVIGAGPAGSAAATRMAEGGLAVAIVESRAFPRVKVCGEFVSPAATGVLESLIGADELLGLGARGVDRFEVVTGRGRSKAWVMPRPAWALGRGSLDAALLERAKRAGAEVIQPESVRGVGYESNGVTVELRDRGELSARLVVHADGSGRHDPAGPVAQAKEFVGLKCHLRLAEPVGSVRMLACRGGYVGLIDIEEGLATAALVASAGLVRRHGGDHDALLATLWRGYDASWRVSEWCASGVARSGYVQPGHARSVRVGNAAGAVDPVGGEGIGLALWSGDLAGRLLTPETIKDADAMGRVRREFGAAYRARLRLRRPACRVASEVLSRPVLTALARPLLGVPSLSIGAWYRLSGKPGTERAPLQET